MVGRVLWSASEGAGTARLHISRISDAEESVVAVSGRRCILFNVHFALRAAKTSHSAVRSFRCAENTT
jgi:hypothetical protein